MKTLSIFAHHEDYILCGYPVLQDKSMEHLLLLMTSIGIDVNREICNAENINLVGSMGLDNRFSFQLDKKQQPRRDKIVDTIKKIIDEHKPDYLFTHNPMGEYGHADHKFLFSIIYNTFDLPLLITDIMTYSSHCVYYEAIPKDCKWAYREKMFDVIPDREFYTRNKNKLKQNKMWTKNIEIADTFPKKAAVYILKD
jgi:LmbE family N-acetylglucosaminyl deacetylase